MVSQTFFNATATFDDVGNKVYATVNSGLFRPGLLQFSKGDDLILTANGTSVLAQVGAFETSGDWATFTLAGSELLTLFNSGLPRGLDILNSGLEQQVLIRTFSKSKPLEKPYATIDVPTANEGILLELKQKIASPNGLNFSEALASLDTSIQVGVIFNAGNPKTMVDIFVADKVKAKFSKKGMIILPAKTKGRFFTDSGSVQERVGDVLWEIREQLALSPRDEQSSLIEYTLSAIDKESKVILNNKQIKNMRGLKKDGKKEYRIQFKENFDQIGLLSGSYTILIKKKTVERLDVLAWYGETLPRPIFDWLLDPYVFNDVTYSKRYVAAAAGLDFDFISPPQLVVFSIGDELVSFTVDNKTIYGVIELGEDNNVKFVKPENVSDLFWAKGLAALKSNGKGVLAQVKKGSLAKEDTLQLKVDLPDLVVAFDVFQGIQATTVAVPLAQLFMLEPYKVTNVEISPAKTEVKVVTAIMSLAKGNIRWVVNDDADNYIEITVPKNSREIVTLCNSNDLSFHDVGVGSFLEAVVADIKTNYEKDLQNIFNSSDTDIIATIDEQVAWMMTVTSGGERFQLELYNALVFRSTLEEVYRLSFPPSQLRNYLSDRVGVEATFTRIR
jgi:hypothetical protein